MSHIHEKIDFTVEVFIVYNKKVLLRVHDKYGVWLSIGGHIELDEDPNEAALREVKEEVGLKITLTGESKITKAYMELIPPKFLNRHSISDTHEHITFVYFAKAITDNIVPENETDVWKWFTHEELEKNNEHIQEDILLYAKQALAELA